MWVVDSATTALPFDYKGPQRRRTRARASARLSAGCRVRLRKWAEFHAQAVPGTVIPASQQVALDVLALLDSLDQPA